MSKLCDGPGCQLCDLLGSSTHVAVSVWDAAAREWKSILITKARYAELYRLSMQEALIDGCAV